ncbi:MAG: AbrB/MazE/SpoVT family DNA-binding domain-containing protein [Spirochaetia bacterium]|jgi:antitoxin PrlF|nr:AbrB/MazE/SpoVT family DNA-binding domain-containing protein [Spirochaetia bacterium]
MEVITSKITSKGQVTVPKSVRDSLGIKEGDFLAYEVHENNAVIRKVPKIDVEWAKSIESTLTEWADGLDDEL